MTRVLSLYDTATSKGRVIRQGEIVQLVMDGSGALVCAAQDFLIASKWAQAKIGSGNIITDRGRFLDKIDVLISRPNSMVATRGSTRPLETLAKLMVQAGYDLSEWTLPIEVKNALKPPEPTFNKPKPKEPEPEAKPAIDDDPLRLGF